jgi:hypothetical protein
MSDPIASFLRDGFRHVLSTVSGAGRIRELKHRAPCADGNPRRRWSSTLLEPNGCGELDLDRAAPVFALRIATKLHGLDRELIELRIDTT